VVSAFETGGKEGDEVRGGDGELDGHVPNMRAGICCPVLSLNVLSAMMPVLTR
jgi:hypothetical protein